MSNNKLNKINKAFTFNDEDISNLIIEVEEFFNNITELENNYKDNRHNFIIKVKINII